MADNFGIANRATVEVAGLDALVSLLEGIAARLDAVAAKLDTVNQKLAGGLPSVLSSDKLKVTGLL